MAVEKKTSYQKGLWAESLASLYLLSKGYKTIQKRYKVKGGEVDLIVCKGRQLAFVEVKARGDYRDAMEAVTPRSRLRIEAAALHFLSIYPNYADYDMRFDIVGVIDGVRVHHLDNAWRPESL